MNIVMNRLGTVAAAALIALLIGGSASAEPHSKANPSESSETAIGDVVADAMRAAFGADAALINAGSLGAGTLPETIDESTIEQIVPYTSDIVVVIKITGADLRAALERSVSSLPRRNSAFLQVSGISFTCDPNAKAGARISSLKIGGKTASDKTTYTVALTDFLAGGGSGYSSLKNGKQTEDEEMTLGDIVMKYADVSEDALSSAGGRINIIENDPE